MNINDNSIRVLLIEDNPGDVRFIEEMLREAKGRKIVLEHCATLTQGLQALSKNDFNILLLDLTLPDSTGFGTFVKVYTQNPQIPIVVLTGTNDEELAIKSVRTGAQDYLIKGRIDSSLLSRSISYAIERAGLLRVVQQELIERKAMESMLRKVNRALHMLSECNGIIVQTSEENVLTEKICRAITTVGEYQFAWIAFIEKEDDTSIQPVAIACSKDSHSPEEASSWFKRDSHSPLSEAITTGREFVCDDVRADKRCSNLAEEADKLGFRSFVILPLVAEGRILGVVQICSKEPDRFDREELKLLEELKEDIAYAIVSIRTQKERKQTDEILRENEEKLRVLFEQLPIGVSLLDKNCKVMYVNPALEKILDLSKDDLLNEKHQTRRYIRTDGTTMPPEELASMRALKEQKLVRDIETGVITESGETIWTSVSAAPFPMMNEGLLVVTSDITERKGVEEALRQSEAKYRSIFDDAAEGIFQSTPEGKFLTANPAMARILGFSSAEGLIRECTDIARQSYVHPEQREEFKRLMEQQNKLFGFEFEVLRKDGSVAWVSETAQAVRDATGRIVRYDGIFIDITERKRAEEALTQERILLRTLIDNLPDGIYVKDTAMRKILVNKADLANIGKPESEVLGKDDYELFPAEVAAHFIEDDKTVLEKGSPILNREELLINEKGQNIWLLTSKLPLRDNKGNISGLIGIGHNITERKQKELEIFKLNRVYAVLSNINQLIVREQDRQTLLNEVCRIAIHDGKFQMSWIGILDVETDSFNPVASAGATGEYWKHLHTTFAKTLVGKEPLRIALFDGQPVICNDIECDDRLISQREKTLALGYRSLAAFPIRTDDKTVGVVNFYSSEKDFFNEEEVILLEELAMDVSYALRSLEIEDQRKRTEKALQESEIKYRSIFENVQDVYYESLIDGTILEVSPSIEIMSKGQYHRNDLIGKSMYDFYSDVRERQALLSALQERGSVSDFEITLKNCDGSKILCSISSKIQFDAQGNPGKIIGSMRDITERKSLQSQLLQTQKVQSIGTLAGGIAHDFNNILGIILAYTSILERSEGDKEKVTKSINAITQAIGRGAGLVRQILTFARQTGVVVKQMLVTDLIREIVVMLKEMFPKVIEFQMTIENNVPFINADHTQMHQVLLNLCVNARDAMPKGGILSIEVKTVSCETLLQRFPKAESDRYISISVSDTGIGMDEETKGRIFDPFFTTKEQGKGTGLGLSVVYGVIQDHHGFISVESKVGQGTTFHLYLPVPREEKKIHDVQKIRTEETQGGTETILFVEDEQLLREVVQSTLESNGYKVLIATNGREAIEIYKKHYKTIALVLSDMGLPKLTGIDAYAMLKEINPNVKVIFASGFISLETRSELLKEGVKGFIMKPYNINEVLQMVRDVLNEK